MALLVKIQILALFGPFLALRGPKYVKCRVLRLERRSVHIVGPEKNIYESNGALLQNAYHKSQCMSPQISMCPSW